MVASWVARNMPSTPPTSAAVRATPQHLRRRRRRVDEPLVDVPRRGRGQHEQDGVAGADLGGEDRGQGEGAEPDRQLRHHHRRQDDVRRWRGPGDSPARPCPAAPARTRTRVARRPTTPMPMRTVLALDRAVGLLHEARRDDETRCQQEQHRPARHAAGRVHRHPRRSPASPARRQCRRARRPWSAPAATATRNPPSRITSCTALTHAELEQPAGREVDRHRDAADGNALPSRQAGDHFEHGRARDQLRRRGSPARRSTSAPPPVRGHAPP